MNAYSQNIPEPCPEFGMNETALAQLKAATANSSTSKIAKKIRLYNTAVKPAPNGGPSSHISFGPNGYSGGPINRSPNSDGPGGSTPTLGDVFDSGDEESRVSTTYSKTKKRKSPSSEGRLGDSSDESPNQPSEGDKPLEKRAKTWEDVDFPYAVDTSEEQIQELVQKHRNLKRSTDLQLAASPHDVSLLDNYFTASLGFFEAAALYELHAKKLITDNEKWRRFIAQSVDLYRGLVPTSEKTSLLSYYLSKCDQDGLSLRAVLGQRCLAMAYARLFKLSHKSLHTSFSALLKSTHRDTLEVKSSQLSELIDILKFGDYYERSENAARQNPTLFQPFPSHPLELNPFAFLEFIRDEHRKVALAEPPSNSGSTSSTSSAASKAKPNGTKRR